MAQSWQRLIQGNYESHDLIMLKHEIMERELIEQGMFQAEAHIKTSLSYDYDREATDYYASLKKNKSKK